MVENIFRLIEKKNEFGKYPQNFSSRIYNRNLTFDEAFKEIEHFSKERNIFVPERLNNLSAKTGYLQPDIQTTINHKSVNSATNPAHQLFEDSSGQSERVFSPILYNQSERGTVEKERNRFEPS